VAADSTDLNRQRSAGLENIEKFKTMQEVILKNEYEIKDSLLRCHKEKFTG